MGVTGWFSVVCLFSALFFPGFFHLLGCLLHSFVDVVACVLKQTTHQFIPVLLIEGHSCEFVGTFKLEPSPCAMCFAYVICVGAAGARWA